MTKLSPCSACGRHVRADAAACPFCRASTGVARVALAVALGASVAACTPAPAPAPVYGGPPPALDRGDAGANADPSKPHVEPAPTAPREELRTLYGAPPPPERP